MEAGAQPNSNNGDRRCIGRVVSFVSFVCLVSVILVLIFLPKMGRFHLDDTSLTQFEYFSATNRTLQYNLTLKINVVNPNKFFGIYYDSVKASAYYKGQMFDAVTLTPFYLRHNKDSVVLSPVFQGQQLLLLGATEISEFNMEKIAGIYNIDVKLYLLKRLTLGTTTIWRYKHESKIFSLKASIL